jgi:beta-mannosidase
MPSFYSWEEVLTSSDDFSFDLTIIISRDHHPPAGDLTFPIPQAPESQAQMTMVGFDFLTLPQRILTAKDFNC